MACNGCYALVLFLCWLRNVYCVQRDETRLREMLSVIDNKEFNYVDYYSLIAKEDDGICGQQFNVYLEGLRGRNLSALEMFDATTKFPDGFLSGNLVHLGNYDQCIGAEVVSEQVSFTGKHCVATLTFTDPRKDANHAQENLGHKNVSPRQDVVADLEGQQLMWSFCIPSGCKAQDLQWFLTQVLENLTNNTNFLQASTSDDDCYVKDWNKLDTADWVMVGILIFFAALVITSTLYDLVLCSPATGRGPGSPSLLLAFSLYSNGKKLLSTTSSGETLGCLNGIRFLTILWVMLGHRYEAFESMPLINLSSMLDLTQRFTEMPVLNAALAVDTFFVLSGLLLCYIFLRDVKSRGGFNIISFYLYRYFRLTPALAIMVGFYATLLYRLGEGPMWHYRVGPAKNACVNNWWAALVYVNNFVHPISRDQCVPQSWYLSVDMQLFVFSPLILYPLWKWPKIGMCWLTLLTLASVAIPFAITFVEEYPWAMVLDDTSHEYFMHLYVPSYTRASPYLVGLAMGYYLYQTRGKEVKISHMWATVGWLFSTAVCIAAIYTLYIHYKSDHEYNVWEASFYSSFHRLGWALGICWIIFACVKGYGGPVNAFLSWNFFQPLSRLTYCCFLTHLLYHIYEEGAAKSTMYVDDYTAVHTFFGDIITTLATAAVLSLVFESPILVLERAIFKKGGARSKPATDNDLEKHGIIKSGPVPGWVPPRKEDNM